MTADFEFIPSTLPYQDTRLRGLARLLPGNQLLAIETIKLAR